MNSEHFPENWSDVLEHHQNLIEQYSPKFMRLRHGTQDEYKNLIQLNGFDKPYGTKNQTDYKVTRITLTQICFRPRRGWEWCSSGVIAKGTKNEDSPYIGVPFQNISIVKWSWVIFVLNEPTL